ncbi:MAG: glycosyltransferase family 2 protein [Planctomycetes bacterium]|nr:glycosyltransferase family 2 protein [Planctomycetota bacterium]
MTSPRASIILPTWNGEAELRRLMAALERQRLTGGFELCAIDSSSSDRSREVLAKAGARIEVIEQKDFRHGATRNRCALGARGEFLVFLSQDVEPVDETFLERLLEAFEDPRVAGVYARILPRPDDDPLTMRTALEAPEAALAPHESDPRTVGDVDALVGARRAEFLRFNNVASAIRADVFRALPFPDVAFGEDCAWSARALAAGWKIRFAPQAVVYHAHRYSPASAFERYKVDAQFQRRELGIQVRPSALSALKGFAYEVRQDLRYLARRPGARTVGYALFSPCLRGAQVLGQWVGSRGEDRSPTTRAFGRTS